MKQGITNEFHYISYIFNKEGTPSGTVNEKPGRLSDKTTFLKLLVTQIKNQNPLNPQDGAAFLAQLAQFSQVEQLVGIRQALDDMKAASSTMPAVSK